MNVVIYCRVSSKEQVEGTSLESQEIACREYAARHHWEVVRVFIERGESAKFADRTQLLELLAFCGKREHGIEQLLVWKVDRLARNVSDHFSIKTGLLQRNIRVVSVTEPIDGNPEGKLLETILAGFAQFDNDLRAARTVQGMRRKIHEGIFPWKPPLGYRGARQPGNKKTDPDQPDQPTFGLLQQGWNEFATGRYTKVEMIRFMTRRGLRTRSGKPLSKQALDNIFRDSFYAGVVRDPWSGEDHTGNHIPMVTQETFATVQRIIAGRSHAVPHKGTRPEFPLRTFVRCLSCERALTGSFSRGRSMHYPYYHCYGKQCNHRGNYRVDLVHGEFTTFLKMVSLNPKRMKRFREYVTESASLLADNDRALNEKRATEIERNKQQMQQLIRMKMQQLITDEEFLAQRSVLSSTLSESEMLHCGPERSTEEVLSDIDAICQPLMHLDEWWKEITPDANSGSNAYCCQQGTFSAELEPLRGGVFSLFSQLTLNSSQTGCPSRGRVGTCWRKKSRY